MYCNRGYCTMSLMSWILLSSRVPREPTRLRLAIWRRLKRLGAVLIHDAVWILPADARTREAFEWLAEEIEEQGGTVWVWEGAGLSPAQDQETIELFRDEANARYAEIGASAEAIRKVMLRRRSGARRRSLSPAALAHAERQLRGLQRALRLERRRDYFRADGRTQAEAILKQALAAVAALAPAPAREGARRAVGD